MHFPSCMGYIPPSQLPEEAQPGCQGSSAVLAGIRKENVHEGGRAAPFHICKCSFS